MTAPKVDRVLEAINSQDIDQALWALLKYYYSADANGTEYAHIPIRDILKLLVDLNKHDSTSQDIDVDALMASFK